MKRKAELLIRYHRALTMVGVMAWAVTAYVLAFALRFDFAIPERFAPVVWATLPLLIGCKLAGFRWAGLFSGSWRHVSVRDVEDIVRGNVIASVLFLASMVFVRGLQDFPRAVFVLDLLLSTVVLCGLRITIRLAAERARRTVVRRIDTFVLIVGAGSAGVRLLEEIERRRHSTLAVVGFVDDDPAKVGMRVSGVPVLGHIDELPALVAAHDVGEVLIALPSANGATLRHVVQCCAEAKVRHRVLPTLGELVEGRVMYTQMREVKVDDLLAREPVRLELARVRALIAGKTVLVTGGAGSIGSELCRQVAAHKPKRVVLYDRHENGVFLLEMELRQRFPEVEIVPVLGDVLLEDQLKAVFTNHAPQLVLHAAAYKHVPMAEQNVLEAVRNNVVGTRNVAQAALDYGAKEFVLVSTDKAVRPTSVMGVTKRAAEMVVQAMQGGSCRFVAVRFGNVLGSSGSVVPLFREQIARGGPVTVTHPEVTRYFMTIPEASQLILQAAAIGNGGDVFILEMGEPVRIADLARQMIRLSGFEPDEDIEIVFTGLRPGEKMHEELIDEEEVAATHHDRIHVVKSARPTTWPDIWLPRLRGCMQSGDVRGALRLLQVVVPSFQPSALHGVHASEPAEAPLARPGRNRVSAA